MLKGTIRFCHYPDKITKIQFTSEGRHPAKAKNSQVLTRGGILAENKFRILDDLFWIHFGRASIAVKFRIICINFGQCNTNIFEYSNNSHRISYI